MTVSDSSFRVHRSSLLMPEPQLDQLFLVPGRTKAETAIWGAAVMEFAVRFPGVFILGLRAIILCLKLVRGLPYIA